jgi:LmbE family N-acetylglucosaminyl deacetylase
MNEGRASLKMLAFFAHPDDETMFLGGTLAFLAERGAEIHFLCATRGEGGEMGNPPICAREDLGQVREAELSCAVKTLGGASLKFAGFKDPLVGPQGELYPFTEDMEQLTGLLREELTKLHPPVIVTHGPGGEYGHPGHIQAYQGLASALEDLPGYSPTVYAPSWLSRETGEFIPTPDIFLDIGPWIDIKIKAVQCHRSQHGLFLRHGAARAGKPVTIPEVVRTREALCRILPAGEGNLDDPLAEMVREISSSGTGEEG